MGTVSHVLNRSAGVAPDLLARVKLAVEELGFVPSQLGRSLRRKRTDMIGMIIPDISNPFFPSVVRGLQDEASRLGFQVILGNSDNDWTKQAGFIDAIRSYRPAGIVLIPADENYPGLPTGDAPETSFPIICIDRVPADYAGDCILSANRDGGRQAAAHLVELGHRRFGLIGGPTAIGTSDERLQGFIEVLREAGLGEGDWMIGGGRFDRTSGLEAAGGWLGGKLRPTAIFAANDLMAVGAIDALRAAGLTCPGDVSVVGFDDLDVATLIRPSLTTVQQQSYAMGKAAAALLRARLDDPGGKAVQQVLPTSLVVRESTIGFN